MYLSFCQIHQRLKKKCDHSYQIIVNIISYCAFCTQIDNAQNFVTLGGLECVMRDLNHTAEVIRSETALVLGSAVQG